MKCFYKRERLGKATQWLNSHIYCIPASAVLTRTICPHLRGFTLLCLSWALLVPQFILYIKFSEWIRLDIYRLLGIQHYSGPTPTAAPWHSGKHLARPGTWHRTNISTSHIELLGMALHACTSFPFKVSSTHSWSLSLCSSEKSGRTFPAFSSSPPLLSAIFSPLSSSSHYLPFPQ